MHPSTRPRGDHRARRRERDDIGDIGDIDVMANARALKYLKISVPVDVTARARDFTARVRAILDGNVFVDDSEALDGRAGDERARERGEIDRIHGGWEFLANSQPTRSST